MLVTAGCSKEAALYDPSTGTFSPTGSMSAVRSGETATLLHDGRVLFAGGYNCAPAGADGTWASAELYDPATGTFSPTGSMAAPRQQHTATLLADGRVLIVGGLSGPSPATAGGVTLASYRTAEVDAFLATAELYDPVTGTFSKTGSMSTPHRGHTATLLQDGRVLVVGNGGESSPSSRAADLYDPATGRFSKTGPMKTGRWLHTATLLQDGRVLILGGRSPKDSVYTGAEMYDPRSGTFSSAPVDARRSSAAHRDPAPGWPRPHRRRLLERRTEVAGPVLDGDVRPGDGQVQRDRLDGCAPRWPHRDAPERRPGPHRRRRGHRERRAASVSLRRSSTSHRFEGALS